MGTQLTPILSIFILTCLASTLTAYNNICESGFNGPLAGSSCSPEYSLCVDGVHQNARCDEGQVFFETKCVPMEESSECSVEESFDCSQLEDGAYGSECTNKFHQCVNGISYPMTCPSSLVFVEKFGKCLESCDAEDYYDYSGEQEAPQFDCSDKQDGTYGSGCTNTYFACVHGTTYPNECPEGLVYNEEKKMCDYICMSPVETTAAPQIYHIETTTLAKDEPKEYDFDCMGKRDGNYADGCSSYYYSCVDGESIRIECQEGLVFNEEKGMCDHECTVNDVLENSFYDQTTKETVKDVQSDKSLEQVRKSVHSADEKTSFDCSGKPDGSYAVGCSSIYYSCSNGALFENDCPSGLVYNAHSDRCDYDCGVSHDEIEGGYDAMVYDGTTTTKAYDETTTTKAYDETTTTKAYDETTTTKAYDETTTTKAYDETTTTKAYDETTTTKAYDETTTTKAYDETTTTKAYDETTTTKAYDDVTKSYHSIDQTFDDKSSFDCSGKPDGSYAVGCSSIYYSCSNGIDFENHCPSGLVYNAHSDRCDYDCGVMEDEPRAYDHSTTTKSYDDTTSTKSYEDATTTKSYDDATTTKNYDDATTTKNYDDATTTKNYDDATTTKNYDDATTTKNYDDATTTKNYDDATTTKTYESSTTTKTYDSASDATFDCSDKMDGLYAHGCSSTYYSCVHGLVYTNKCPHGLVFNDLKEMCDYSCAEHHEQVDGYIEEPQQQPVEFFDCSNRMDGVYADGCSNAYYSCANGHTYVHKCPLGLFYNEKKVRCDYGCESGSTEAPVYQENHDEPEVIVTTAVPVYQEETTTIPEAYDETTSEAYNEQSTTMATSYQQESTSAQDVEVTTRFYGNVAKSPVTRICTEGEITSFGRCATRFTKCQKNKISNKQCPAQTIFDTSILLCVFDHVECQERPVYPQPTRPTTTYQYEHPDLVLNPFADFGQYRPIPRRRHHRHHHRPVERREPLVENPFYVPPRMSRSKKSYHHRVIDSPFAKPHHDRKFVMDKFQDYRGAKMEKIDADQDTKEDRRRFLVEDGFVGSKSRRLVSNVAKVFPARPDFRRRRPVYHPRHIHNDYQRRYRRKRSIGYGNGIPSSFQQPQKPVSSRQQQVNEHCANFTKPIFLNFGNCVEQFIYCSGTGRNRMAACPIGETFDIALGACTEDCGVQHEEPAVTYSQEEEAHDSYETSTQFDSTTTTTESTTIGYGDSTTEIAADGTSTVQYDSTTKAADNYEASTSQYEASSTKASDSYETTSAHYDATTKPFFYSTKVADVSRKCDEVSSGLIGLGCSQEYLHCSQGVAIRRTCPASLYFDQDLSICNYRDMVPECQGVSSAEEQESTPTAYVPTMAPYKPESPKQLDTTDACKGLSDGFHGVACSATFMYCRGQKLVKTMTCKLGEGFDPSVEACKNFADIPAYICDSERTTTDAGLVQPLPYRRLDTYLNEVGEDQVEQTSTTKSYEEEKTTVGAYEEEKTTVGAYEGEKTTVGAYDEEKTTMGAYDEEKTTVGAYDEEKTTVGSYSPETTTYQMLDNESTTTSTYGEHEEQPKDSSYIVLDDTEETTTTSSDSYISLDDSTTPESEVYRSADAPKEEIICMEGSRASTGHCRDNYLECKNNRFIVKTCVSGMLYDNDANDCVESSKCGQQSIRRIVSEVISATPSPYKTNDKRCENAAENELRAMGKCRSSYIRCAHGRTVIERCAENKIFSDGECVERKKVSHCVRKNPMKGVDRPSSGDAFCQGRVDGLYRNPEDCSGILQCFGGDLFEYPSCPASLAFNEHSGRCDYPQNVAGCDTEGRTEGECDEHGSFVADDNDCGIFYRCVWGQKVQMRCPSGTVFNADLSVCDWPSAVPRCSAADDSLIPY